MVGLLWVALGCLWLLWVALGCFGLLRVFSDNYFNFHKRRVEDLLFFVDGVAEASSRLKIELEWL